MQRARVIGAVIGVMGLTSVGPWVAPCVGQEKPEPVLEGGRGAVKEPFKVENGPYGVVQFDTQLRDEKHAKNLEVRVRAPKLAEGEAAPAAGFPLLVFSHGAGGSREAFPQLLDLLASHGYVCIAPTHSDSIQQKLRAGKAPELRKPEGRRALRRSVDLEERVTDCTLILDNLRSFDELFSDAYGTERGYRINPDQIAIAGHSAGAFTAQLCAGVKVRGVSVGRAGKGMVNIGDERFKAAIIISGQGTGSLVLNDSSWSDVKVPLLVFSGSLDGSPPDMGNETPATRRHPFEKSRGTAQGGPPAYLLSIEGATHGSYQGKIGAGERIQDAAGKAVGATPVADVGGATNAAVLTFLNAHVRGDARALETLNSDALARTIPGKVEYKHK